MALELSENAVRVLEKRYLVKDDEGRAVETPEELFTRVAHAIAAPDRTYDPSARLEDVEAEFYDLVASLDFMPNSPTLMNAGRPLGQLSACFVLPVGDSMEEIFDSLKFAALIHKSGGGTGFAFSRLRPRNDVVRSTMGISSGPVSFMNVFNHATEAVKQGGTRRGANMGILRVDHPDILQFIQCKRDLSQITNFNISVALTERFMEAAERDEDYELINPRSKQGAGRLKAREVLQQIVHNAWETGEPGIVFIDRINQRDPLTPVIGEIEATNPCGEQPLHAFDSCNLGSINLARMATAEGAIDWDHLRRVVRSTVHFLDNVIDANHYPIPQIDATSKANRKIGLGVMGWADLLIQQGIPYDSAEATALGERLMKFIQTEGHRMSEELAEVRGPFPRWKGSRPEAAGEKPRRNSTVTTIAPTGTISIIAGCSGGIEPIFAVAFVRNQAGMEMPDVNPAFVAIARREGWYSEDLMMQVARRGTVRGLQGVPEKWQGIFATSHDVTPEWHVRMQAAFQQCTDNAVSKTVNFPSHATEGDVAEVYWLAYKLGCKGVTVYRDGSRPEQVLNIDKVNRGASGLGEGPTAVSALAGAIAQAGNGNGNGNGHKPGVAQEEAHAVEAPPQATAPHAAVEPRPRRVPGATYRAGTPTGTAYITINDRDGEPFEVFINVGKAGSDMTALAEALGRLASLVLRLPSQQSSKDRAQEIVNQLARIGGRRSTGFGSERVSSLPDALAKVLAEHVGIELPGTLRPKTTETFCPNCGETGGTHKRDCATLLRSGDLCPECNHATFVWEEGCRKCHSCGHSEC